MTSLRQRHCEEVFPTKQSQTIENSAFSPKKALLPPVVAADLQLRVFRRTFLF